ncbi:hypothetical protein HYQ46_009987 [Verticillium longisporum]|nr:hypothetical protein HYQ46_009987 [Verticillium longisporum]
MSWAWRVIKTHSSHRNKQLEFARDGCVRWGLVFRGKPASKRMDGPLCVDGEQGEKRKVEFRMAFLSDYIPRKIRCLDFAVLNGVRDALRPSCCKA